MAQDAAGEIHSDIARGFIRAEVIRMMRSSRAAPWPRARSTARVRLEGKEYIVKDGDIINFRHAT